jgi:hypothetical protein
VSWKRVVEGPDKVSRLPNSYGVPVAGVPWQLLASAAPDDEPPDGVAPEVVLVPVDDEQAATKTVATAIAAKVLPIGLERRRLQP